MNRTILLGAALVLVLGCKKSREGGSGGESARSLDAVAAQAALVAQAMGLPDVESSWSPGAIREDVAIEALGIKVDHPENVTLAVEGRTARFTAEGFYPVTITVEKLTLENAALKVEVDGVPQLGKGTTWDGNTQIIQTDCELVRCTIAKPEGWYVSEVADAGTMICKSIETAPPPMAPGLDSITSSNSTGGQCPEGTMERGEAFLGAAKSPDVSAALEACWSGAVAANPAWRGRTPTADVRMSNWSGSWERKVELRDLEGDSAALLECLTAATAPLDAKMPAEALPEGCTLMSVAYVHFGEKVACP
ncbi:MAG: hypothetical protein HY907_09330 [Deltaproteobacteria bacterium]|nr:hypothetical protein [Deltaproteobacteria bacterium]